MGKDRETNVIIHNKCTFAFSEEELPCVQKCKQVCVNAQCKERSNGNLEELDWSA